MESKEMDTNIDDFDLLEAKVDPRDIRTIDKIARLEEEIEDEKNMMRMMY